MQWNDMQKDWKNIAPKFQARWPKLTEADIKAIGGKRDELVRRLTAYYPAEKETLGKTLDAFVKTLTLKV